MSPGISCRPFSPASAAVVSMMLGNTFMGGFLENVSNPFLNLLIPSALQPLANSRGLLPNVY